eukprot:3010344-Pyramimonas_sp.AAC.1
MTALFCPHAPLAGARRNCQWRGWGADPVSDGIYSAPLGKSKKRTSCSSSHLVTGITCRRRRFIVARAHNVNSI